MTGLRPALITASMAGGALFAAESAIPELNENVRIQFGHPTEIRYVDGDRIHYGLAGFHLSAGQMELIGRALRINVDKEHIFATGSLILTRPGLRLTCDRLQADANFSNGQAWNVHIRIPHPGGAIRLWADSISFTPTAITCHQVKNDAGHGGALTLIAKSLVIGLREQPDESRQGPARHLTHLAMWHPVGKIGYLPIAYSPVLYRDFILDYPWTHYEAGTSSRLGPWIQGSTRVNIGRHLQIYGHAHWYERAGFGAGIRPRWDLGPLGSGEVLWFGFDEEKVRRSSDPGPPTERRHAHVFDFEHALTWPGGGGHVRWTELPPADEGASVDERFRNDYLQTDLDERGLARRGAEAAWSIGGIAIAGLIDLPPAERTGYRLEGGADLGVPDMQLVGPLHISGRGRADILEDQNDNDSANRYHYRLGVGATHWLPWGLGFDAQLDVQSLRYDDAYSAGAALADAQRTVPIINLSTRMRWEGIFEDGTRHTFIPRLQARIHGNGSGTTLPNLNFADGDDEWIEDRRVIITGFETAITRKNSSFDLDIEAIWAIRSEDAAKPEVEDLGDRLLEIDISAHGRPNDFMSVFCEGTWSGSTRSWERFNLAAWIEIADTIQLGAHTRWQENDKHWQYQPEIRLTGRRYRTTIYAVYDDDDLILDSSERWSEISVELGRQQVDGQLTIGYSYERNRESTTDPIDHRFTIGFTWHPLGGY